MEHLKGVLLGWAPAIPTNIMLSCKDLQGMNTLVYYEKIVLAKVYEYAPWGQCYKTFYMRKLQIFVIS